MSLCIVFDIYVTGIVDMDLPGGDGTKNVNN